MRQHVAGVHAAMGADVDGDAVLAAPVPQAPSLGFAVGDFPEIVAIDRARRDALQGDFDEL